MDDPEKPDPSTGSNWELVAPDLDSVGFLFQKNTSILPDFPWNLLHADTSGHRLPVDSDHRFDFTGPVACSSRGGAPSVTDAPADQPDPSPYTGSSCSSSAISGSATAVADMSASNPSGSSGSSEDPPENSTGSGNPPEIPKKEKKKKGLKRIRQPRFAFMTKSDVDHLEDGYRWRKYGQKAVKNSPFPRSYYRCTNTKCTVKKRVERSFEDPTTVITTYEGQHCHHTAGHPRRGGIFTGPESHFTSYIVPQALSNIPYYYQGVAHQLHNECTPHRIDGALHYSPLIPPSDETPESRPPVAEGLLGDIVPPRMRNR